MPHGDGDDDETITIGEARDAVRLGILKLPPTPPDAWKRSQAMVVALGTHVAVERCIASMQAVIGFLDRQIAESDNRLVDAKEFDIGDPEHETLIAEHLKQDRKHVAGLLRETQQMWAAATKERR